MTREDRLHEIEDYVGYLDALSGEIFAAVDRASVEFIALGFSQGVATVCRWAARAPVPPDRLVLWAGAPPDELSPTPGLFGDAHVTLVLGDEDPWARDGVAQRLIEHLRAGGMPFEMIRFPGGHELDASVLSLLAGDSGSVP
jgi:predicted esterase